ncbi:putative plasmid stability protein [Marinobacter sp. ELB17]|nr:putative plasmid stability protein [Marinobacter sp. ELB17]
MIVLDTSVISEAMKPEPNPAVRAWLNEQSAETRYMSTVSLAELFFGVAALPNGKRKDMLSEALNGLMELFKGRVLSFDAGAARKAVTARLMPHSRPRVSNDNPYSESLFAFQDLHFVVGGYGVIEVCQHPVLIRMGMLQYCIHPAHFAACLLAVLLSYDGLQNMAPVDRRAGVVGIRLWQDCIPPGFDHPRLKLGLIRVHANGCGSIARALGSNGAL